MIVGIMSDSHGNVARTVQAISRINDYRPAHVFHCGDICGQPIVTELEAGFADTETPVTCVLGNCDAWEGALTAAMPYVKICPRIAEAVVDGKQIAVTHGHEAPLFHDVCASGRYDYVFTGHTHQRSDERNGRTRIINPGALHRSPCPSCAVLDLRADELTFLELI